MRGKQWCALIATVCCLTAPVTLADGNETLGPPSIDIADGTEIVAAGTGLFEQPGSIELTIPTGAEIRQVLLYWQGRGGAGDDTVRLNMTEEVTGVLIGNNIAFQGNSWAYRQDITDLDLIGVGNNTVMIDQMNFSAKNDGATILVILDEGSGGQSIEIRDGMDFAYFAAPTPETMVTNLETFTFPDTMVDRPGRIWVFLGDGTENRPDEFELTIGDAEPLVLSNEARGRDGEEWDTVPIDFMIPSGTTSVGIQLFSRGGGNPDSLSWVAAVFEQPCSGSIGDFVWNDLNGNGIQDTGEPGIAGVTVTLETGSGASFQSVTDAEGAYLFGNLCAGTYTVEVDETTVPMSFTQTLCNVGDDDTVDSNCQPATVELPEDFSTDLTIDFGYVGEVDCTGQIGDFVWNDANRNGLQDMDEPGIPGVAVYLYMGMDETPSAMTTTDMNGMYLFQGLCAGDYRVEPETPEGLVPTDCEVGDDPTIDSNCSPAMVTLETDESVDLTIDFGFYEPQMGNQGCTPGYWKNHPLAWNYTDYTPDVLIGDVWSSANEVVPSLADHTLLEALNFGGGGGLTGAARNLFRIATASLLNASHEGVNFPLTVDQIVDGGNTALETEDRHEILALKDALDWLNNTYCPLGRLGTAEHAMVEYTAEGMLLRSGAPQRQMNRWNVRSDHRVPDRTD
jgi:hypothetical protein